MCELIRLDDVTVRFGSLVALDHVNISVRAGEIVALTRAEWGRQVHRTAQVASGQISPTSGESMIAGQPAETAKAIVGILPDKDNHFEEFTARRKLGVLCCIMACVAAGLRNVFDSLTCSRRREAVPSQSFLWACAGDCCSADCPARSQDPSPRRAICQPRRARPNDRERFTETCSGGRRRGAVYLTRIRPRFDG